MLSKLQERKLVHLFRLLDQDESGHLERRDVEALARRIAAARGLGNGDPKTKSIVAGHVSFWTRIEDDADSDGDGRVTRDEWLAYFAALLAKPELYEQAMGPLSKLVMSILDADGDGFVTNEEHRSFMAAYRVPEGELDEALSHTDPKKVGRVS